MAGIEQVGSASNVVSYERFLATRMSRNGDLPLETCMQIVELRNQKAVDLRTQLKKEIDDIFLSGFSGGHVTTNVANLFRVRFNLGTGERVPLEHIPEAIEIVRDIKLAARKFLNVRHELYFTFVREVIGGREPWTPWIKRTLKRDVEKNPNWRELLAEVMAMKASPEAQAQADADFADV